MKRNLIFKASGIAIAAALGTFAMPTMAQDYPSSVIDTPSQTGPTYYEGQPTAGTPYYMVPLEDRSWGNQPRTQFRADRQRPLRGAQGPIRSDDAQDQGTRMERARGFFRQPVGNRGFEGFLGWRESNTDTP